jgi:hypothetical protein
MARALLPTGSTRATTPLSRTTAAPADLSSFFSSLRATAMGPIYGEWNNDCASVADLNVPPVSGPSWGAVVVPIGGWMDRNGDWIFGTLPRSRDQATISRRETNGRPAGQGDRVQQGAGGRRGPRARLPQRDQRRVQEARRHRPRRQLAVEGARAPRDAASRGRGRQRARLRAGQIGPSASRAREDAEEPARSPQARRARLRRVRLAPIRPPSLRSCSSSKQLSRSRRFRAAFSRGCSWAP